jgi:hypothetical protein
MRTKTMILSASCGLLGALAAQADSVYSVNVVGYVNISFTANTYKLVTNPLNTTNNTLSSVFASLTDDDGGAVVYIWDNANAKYHSYMYLGVDSGWLNVENQANANADTFAPGQGAWVNFVNGAKQVTFVGDVAQGTLTEQIYTGWNTVGSIVPQQGDITVDLGLSNATDGDVIYRRTTRTTNPWDSWTYMADAGAWLNSDTGSFESVVLGVGEAVWYSAMAPSTWTRTFSVN